MQINKTNEYEKFKIKDENRDTNVNHVSKLVAAMKTKSLLIDFPILVDNDFNILDGQHRFEAAKLLNHPIYYKHSISTNMGDVPFLNSINKSWSFEDYLNQYVNQGNVNYMKFNEFINWSKIPSVNLALKFIKNYKSNAGSGGGASFKLGRFIYPNNDSLIKNNLIKFIELNKYCSDRPFNRAVVKCFDILNQNESYDHDRMMEKLSKKPVPPFSNSVELFDHLERIYNFNVIHSNKVLFKRT